MLQILIQFLLNLVKMLPAIFNSALRVFPTWGSALNTAAVTLETCVKSLKLSFSPWCPF